jgi:hypothetical protein
MLTPSLLLCMVKTILKTESKFGVKMLQLMELLPNIALVTKLFGMEMEVNHGSSNLNYHMESIKSTMLTKVSSDIESETMSLHTVLMV